MIRLGPLQMRLRVPLRPPRLLATAWLGAVALLELFGRRSTTDVLDALGVAAIVLLVLITVIEHRRRRLPLITFVLGRAQRLWERVGQQTVRVGVDLRGAPALPRAFPPIMAGSAIGTTAVLGVVGSFHASFPQNTRTFLLAASPTLYVVLLAAVWAALACVALFSLVFTGVCFHNWIVNVPRLQRPQRVPIEAGAFGVGFGALVAAGLLLPVWIPLAALGSVLLVTLVVVGVPGAPRLDLAWQPRGGGPVASTPWYSVVAAVAVTAATALAALAILAVGDRLRVPSSTVMPVTTFLGGTAVWTGALGYLMWAWSFPLKAFMHRFRDPAKPQAYRAMVASPPALEKQWLHTLHEAGFAIHRTEPDLRRYDTLCIELYEGARPLEESAHYELPIAGTVRVHPMDLGHPDIHDAIRRSTEVERRRSLLKGLDELLGFATRRGFEHGHGFWIAPHLWFVTHMTRDTSEDDSWLVGPPYHRVLSLAARHHLYRVLEVLQVDLVFVEDGVTFDQLRLVFQALFDIFDLFGGNRAEERHFDGLAGLRVVIHEFTMNEPFRDEGYPEVNYEEIGRARILHVFRDRGGTDDQPDVPIDADLVGAPALV